MFSIEISKIRRIIQYSNGDGFLNSSSFDEFYLPRLNDTTSISGYDCTKRPWFIMKYVYPQYIWSEVWIHFFYNFPSISAVSKLDYPMFIRNGSELEIVEELVGLQYNLAYLDELLSDTVRRHLDTNTKSVEIVLVERSGELIANSFSQPTVVEKSRFHISKINKYYESLAEELEERHILLNQTYLSSKPFPTNMDLKVNSSSFYFQGDRISVTSIRDNGLDWVFVISTVENSYVNSIVFSSPILLSVSIVLIVIGTLIMIILTQLVALSIIKVVNNNIRLSRMEIRKVTSSKISNIIYELSLLQKSTNAIKRGLTSFMHYIPKDLVCDIVKTGQFAQLGMVNTHTTVMFTDIANFTTISETTSISDLIEILSAYFSIISQSVEKNNGIIDKFIGDGTMSIFSTPYHYLNNHAKCACDAAILSIQEIEKFKEKSQKMKWPIVEIRVGINTGEAMIGNIGWEERFNYTAIGDCVNTSSRLESLGKHYNLSILIGEESYEAVKENYLCFFVDSVRMKGKVTSINVYAIETSWNCATKTKISIHDKLEVIRNLMHLRDFTQMNTKLKELLKALYEWNLPRSQVPCSDRIEEGLFSNMQFVVDLLNRSEIFISQQDITDLSLEMKEK